MPDLISKLEEKYNKFKNGYIVLGYFKKHNTFSKKKTNDKKKLYKWK